MGEWRLPSDVLAGARFAVSPLLETVGAVTLLRGRGVEPWHRPWLELYRPRFESMLDDRPLWRPLLEASLSAVWVADSLAAAPVSSGSFHDELAPMLERTDEAVLADLEAVPGGRIDPALRQARGLAEEIGALLSWVWQETVEPEWERRSQVLAADVVSRTAALAAGGWVRALAGLRKNLEYLGDGVLRISALASPRRDLLPGSSLVFYPLHVGGGFVTWTLPSHFAVCYPVSGQLAGSVRPTRGLVRLLGLRRADLLGRLGTPLSTTQLAALTGYSPAAVSNHLSALRGAGLVERRRAGRSVLYWRSPLGDQLHSATADPPTA